MSALVAPSGECFWDEGLVWLIGAVVCSLAAAAMDGHISILVPLALADHLPLR